VVGVRRESERSDRPRRTETRAASAAKLLPFVMRRTTFIQIFKYNIHVYFF
jgi:hypothetical protein